MSVAYSLLVTLAAVLFTAVVFLAALVTEYRFRLTMFPPRWAGGLSRQIIELKELVVSNQERLDAAVAEAVADLEVIREKLAEHPAAEVLDFGPLDAFVAALDEVAKSVVAEPVSEEEPAPGEGETGPVQE